MKIREILKYIFAFPKSWKLPKLSKKRMIALVPVLFIIIVLLSPHLGDIFRAKQEYIAEQNIAEQDPLTDATKLIFRLFGKDATNALKDKLTTQDAGICLDIDPTKIKIIILETDVEAIERTGPQIDIWAINKLIGNRFSCFLDIPIRIPYLESPIRNGFVIMYTTGVYGGPVDTIKPKYYITRPSVTPKYVTYILVEGDITLVDINADRSSKLLPYVGYILVPRSVASSLRGDYKDHFEIVPPEGVKKLEEYLGIEIPEEEYVQSHDQGLVDALSIGDIQIIGRDAAYKTVLWGQIINTQYIKTYSGWYGGYTAKPYTGEFGSQSMEESHLLVALQGDITGVRYFEIRLKDISIDVDRKDKYGDHVLKKETRDLLTQKFLLFSFEKNVKIINARSGEVGDVMNLFVPEEQSEILSVAIEVTCWSEDMYSYFGEQHKFDREALFNPEMGKPIYKTGAGETIMEWGTLTIDVDYREISSAMEYLTFFIVVRFPDPEAQETLIDNANKNIPTRSKEINTITLSRYADDICNNEWWYQEIEQGYGYVIRPPHDDQRTQIWVPIIDGKFTETKVEYYIDFYTFKVPKEEFESIKNDREKLAENVVSSSTFGIQIQAGQSFRTSTETKDSCREWVSKWVPGMFKPPFYTYCTLKRIFHKALIQLKEWSTLILGGGPAATIKMAQLYDGKLSVAITLGLLTYMFFILAFLFMVFGFWGGNLDMSWFGFRIWLFLAAFSALQIRVGYAYHEPYGLFSLVGRFFEVIIKSIKSLIASIVNNPEGMFLIGCLAVTVAVLWIHWRGS